MMSEEIETEQDGEIIVTVSDRLSIKTNMSPSETNLWLDRAKIMIVTGDFDQEDSPEET